MTPLIKPSNLTTNNFKKATVLAVNEQVEEEVTLLIEGTVVTCFASYCPYEIEVGKTYDVELTLNLAEHYEAKKTCSNDIFAVQINNGFSYILYGDLRDDTFQTFTSLKVEDIHHDHPDLNNSFIKLSIERIDVAFQETD